MADFDPITQARLTIHYALNRRLNARQLTDIRAAVAGVNGIDRVDGITQTGIGVDLTVTVNLVNGIWRADDITRIRNRIKVAISRKFAELTPTDIGTSAGIVSDVDLGTSPTDVLGEAIAETGADIKADALAAGAGLRRFAPLIIGAVVVLGVGWALGNLRGLTGR